MSRTKHNPRNEKPISLRPLSLADALKKAMQAKPPMTKSASSTSKQSSIDNEQTN